MTDKEKKPGSLPLRHEDLCTFFENMAMLLKAGISLTEAADLIREETVDSGTPLAASLSGLCEAMDSGATFADAMRCVQTFPDYAVDMVEASEYMGRTEDTLFHLADYYRSESAMRRTFMSAVRYPVILLLMVIALLIAMIALVFPAFYGVYNNLTGSLSASSFNYIHISFNLCVVMLVVMIILVAALIIGLIAWKKGKREKIRALLMRFGSFKELFDNLDLYRFTSCFDMFITGGEMQDEAVKKSMPVVETRQLHDKLERCITKMEEGKSFSQTAYEEHLYDSMNNRMLIPAERSGMLDTILSKILANLREKTDSDVARIANTVEPLLTGFLMIFIGLMLISLMVPLIGIMNSIG